MPNLDIPRAQETADIVRERVVNLNATANLQLQQAISASDRGEEWAIPVVNHVFGRLRTVIETYVDILDMLEPPDAVVMVGHPTQVQPPGSLLN